MKKTVTKKSDIGLIGLAVMGKNLARNIADKGFKVSVFNRTTSVTTDFIKEFPGQNLYGTKTIREFVSSLKTPRKIIIMVKAGEAVDAVIAQLTPHLKPQDIITDCGNSNFSDTQRRHKNLAAKKLNFIGCGVSGGEEGALNGPSLMPGGAKSAYAKIKPILDKIAAKDFSKKPCVTYVGSDGAGHYVKMVHNGIEYAVMQIMAEGYGMLRDIYHLSAPKIAKIFAKYNRGPLNSYLFEIAVKVLSKKDPYKKGWLIDYILDSAEQKGTGRWTAIDALDHGTATPTIAEAVFARNLSAEKQLRTLLSKKSGKGKFTKIPLNRFTGLLEKALYTSMLSAYAQGLDLIKTAATTEKWQINPAEIIRIWEGGCIIRAKLLTELHQSYKKNPRTTHLLSIPSLRKKIDANLPALRQTVAYGFLNSAPIGANASALNYIESLTNNHLPANFIQGLRDFFGAHTYKRLDKKGTFHTEWE